MAIFNLRMLRALPKKLWENYGMHSERREERVRMYAGHHLNHLAQVEKIAKASGSKRRRVA